MARELEVKVVVESSAGKRELAEVDKAVDKIGHTAASSSQRLQDAFSGVKLETAATQIRNFDRELNLTTERATKSWTAMVNSFDAKKAAAPFAALISAVGGTEAAMILLAAGAGAAGAALGALGLIALGLASAAARVGAALRDASLRLDVSVEDVSRLSNAATVAGTNLDQLSGVITTIQKRMADHPDAFANGLAKIGLQFETFKFLAPDKQLLAIAEGLKAQVDPLQKNAAGYALMGSQFKEIEPALDKLNKAMALTKDLNPWTDAEARQAEEFQMAVAALRLEFDQLAVSAGREVLPFMLWLVENLPKIVSGWADLAKHAGELILPLHEMRTGWQLVNGEIAYALVLLDLFRGKQVSLPAINGQIPGTPLSPSDAKSNAFDLAHSPDALVAKWTAAAKNPGLVVPIANEKTAVRELAETYRALDDARKKAASAASEYAKAWQKNDEDTQAIWSKAFIALQRIDKDSLTSHLAVLEEQRQADLNAAANRIADTTKSADQYRAREFAINAQYDALEYNATMAAVKKVETDTAAIRFTELTSSSAAQMKASQTRFELDSKTIGETQKLWIDFYDFEAKKAGDSAGYQIAQIQRWVDEKRLAAKNAGIIDQQYYDALNARAKQQMDAIIAGEGTLRGPIPGMLLYKPSMSDLGPAINTTKEWQTALRSVAHTIGEVGAIGGPAVQIVTNGILSAVMATADLSKAMGQITKDQASGGAGWNAANLTTIAAGWIGIAVAIYQVTANLIEAQRAANALEDSAFFAKQVGKDFGTPQLSPTLSKDIENLTTNIAALYGLSGRNYGEALKVTAVIDELGGISHLTAEQLARVKDLIPDLFTEIAKGGRLGALATSELNKVIGDFADNLAATGGVADQFFLDLIERAHDSGLALENVTKYLKSQAAALASGLSGLLQQPLITSADAVGKTVAAAQKAIDDLTKTGNASSDEMRKAQDALTDALTVQHGEAERNKQALEDIGYAAIIAFDAAIASGAHFTEALKGIAPQLATIQKAFRDLGIEADNPALKGLLLENTILNGTADKPSGLGTAIGGLQAIFTAARNIPGLMTPEGFGATQRTLSSLYTQTQAATEQAGGTTINALLPFQQSLHAIVEYAAKNHVDIDANTQQMIDQSKELGIWTDDFKTDSEKTRQSIADLIASNDRLIAALGGSPFSGDGAGHGQVPPWSENYPGKPGPIYQPFPTVLDPGLFGGTGEPGVVYHAGGAILPLIPRAHRGLAVDERMIIAQTGEGVLNRSAMQSIGGAAGLNSLNAGGAIRSGVMASGAPVFNLNLEVVIQGGGDPEDMADQFTQAVRAKLMPEIDKRWREMMRSEGHEIAVQEFEDGRRVSRMNRALSR